MPRLLKYDGLILSSTTEAFEMINNKYTFSVEVSNLN